MSRKIVTWVGVFIVVLLTLTIVAKLVLTIDKPTPTSVVTNNGSTLTPVPTIDGPTPTSPQTHHVSSPSGEAMPVGDISGWKLIFSDDFNTDVPLGAFSDCKHHTDTPQAYCGGLKPYGAYYSNWWAYPNTWSDTAKSGADGNTGAPFGGVYHQEDTVSVSNGAMHINMFRPRTGGDNHVATVVPIKCMNHQYGRYVERFKVVKADPGFKSAHLFYTGGYEIDYPENDYGSRISAYTHPGGATFRTSARWTEWHTTAIEWTASSVKFYMDGKLIGTTSKRVPHIPMSWILQNESSILGPYAKPGASAQLDIDWVACYSPAS
jgi:Glycosyl hydrolases family 16